MQRTAPRLTVEGNRLAPITCRPAGRGRVLIFPHEPTRPYYYTTRTLWVDTAHDETDHDRCRYRLTRRGFRPVIWDRQLAAYI